MRVLVERSGGFTGIGKKAEVDSESLPAEDSGELQKLVDEAAVFDLPESPAAPPRGADQFEYKLTVDGPEGQRSIALRDPPPPVKRLLDWMWAHQK
jgi:hypothetical protein